MTLITCSLYPLSFILFIYLFFVIVLVAFISPLNFGRKQGPSFIRDLKKKKKKRDPFTYYIYIYIYIYEKEKKKKKKKDRSYIFYMRNVKNIFSVHWSLTLMYLVVVRCMNNFSFIYIYIC
jgi:hypothetical protein